MDSTLINGSPFLQGHHLPNRMEVDAPDLMIRGQFPEDLAGVFYRNGAEPLYPPTDENYHWFDGDGMIYAVFIEDGRVALRNRWVRTDKLLLEMGQGRKLFGVFGSPGTSDPLTAGTKYNTANTNVIIHGGKLLALQEGAPPIELDPRSLATIGEHTYGGVVRTTFSAHPKVDHTTGELINIGATVHGFSGAAELRYDIIDFNGQPTKTEFIPVPHMGLMHTFFVTENWVVFPVTPLDQSLERALRGGPLTAWNNDRPTKLGVMPRNGSPAEVRWFEADPRHMMHEANVWEENGCIVADVAAAEGTALFPTADGIRSTHHATQQNLRRWTIDPYANSLSIREEILNDHDIQFPRPDDRLMTRPSRHAFANSNLYSEDGRVDGMDSVIRVDTRTGQEDLYHFGHGTAAGELIFAPRIAATDELDGYALTLVHHQNSPETELVVFNARDIAGGPIASAVVPFRIPSGFHCSYYSIDSPLYKQAFNA